MSTRHADLERFLAAILLTALVIMTAACARSEDSLVRLDGSRTAIDALEREVESIMRAARLPGLQVAVINDGRVVYTRGFGVKSTAHPDRVDARTVFAALSFSKTLFTYLVMRLVDADVIDLDRPLVTYLGKPLPAYEQYVDLEGDERHRLLTARMVLSHTTGFPNWRWFTPEGKLGFLFEPGERFSYSGEGIALLQLVVEEITEANLESLARTHIFTPIGLERTSFVFRSDFDDNYAIDHDRYGNPVGKNKRDEASAAGSAQTTAADYAAFLVAVMRGDGLSPEIHRDMFSRQVKIRHVRMFGPLANRLLEPGQNDGTGWGLGWGRVESEHGPGHFHTGNDFGAANYHIAFPDRRTAVILFGSSQTLENAAPSLTELLIGDTYSPYGFLGYEPHDSPRHRLVDRIASEGLEAGLQYYERLADKGVGLWFLDEWEFLDRVGQDLLGLGLHAAAADFYQWALSSHPDRLVGYDRLATARVALDDLDGARDSLAAAVSRSTTKDDTGRFRWRLAWIDALTRPVELEEERLRLFAGRYEQRNLVLRDGALHYHRDGTNTAEYRRLYAMSDDTFVMREADSFRLRFVRDPTGKVDRIIGLYIDGNSDETMRDPE